MQVLPFRAFRFDPNVVGDATKCIAAPYDVINDKQQQQLYDKSPYNIVHITKGKTSPDDSEQDNQYTRAAGYLNEWVEQGAIKQENEETIYGYVQDFKNIEPESAGVKLQRISFIALGRLEEFGDIVKPHEQILNKPLVDRFNLKKATEAEFGLVFMLYEDNKMIAEKIVEKAIKNKPLVDYLDEQDVRHRLFPINDNDNIRQISEMMNNKSCIIADGHHRYTTGLNYSKQSNNPAAKHQMMAFSNMSHEGLIVLATHRLVGNLKNFNFNGFLSELKQSFNVTKLTFGSSQEKLKAKQQMLALMKKEFEADNNAFGIYVGDSAFYIAILKDKKIIAELLPNMSKAWQTLDVSVLHTLIIEKILGLDKQAIAKGGHLKFVKGTSNAIDESINEIDSGLQQAGFFMNPIKMQQLKNVTDAGERMPQKSTFFYPKVFSGLTIQKF